MRPDENSFLYEVLRGDEAAVEFCECLFRISQTLDDLIDKDRALTDGQIVDAFWQALIELPGNPFYQQHFHYLRPLMASAMQDWVDSVALERADDYHSRTLAFVLRDQLTGVVIQCAYLIGGSQWMREVGPVVRAHFHDEPLCEYIRNLS